MENNKIKIECDGKPKVAFICNHNACRSQMAEAIGKLVGSDVFESYSAGTIIKNQINQDAVRMIKKIYDIDMEKTQYNKTINDIPKPDIVIFMGCNVSCANISAKYTENWGLDDPSVHDDEFFTKTIQTIYDKMVELKNKLS